jgi:transcriptional regulator with XRE-family HTH domain
MRVAATAFGRLRSVSSHDEARFRVGTTRVANLLTTARNRLKPEEAGLHVGSSRRVPGLRQSEVAELVGVSTRWYERFEQGYPDRRFSVEFVHRVAEALRLDNRERATLFRLSVPELRVAVEQVERSAQDGALHSLERIRALARRLTAVSSFEDAARAAAETVESILSPSCAAVATLLSSGKSPDVIAFGRRAHLAGAAFAESCIAANYPSRFGHTTFNESRPAYRDTVDGSFAFRQQTNDGRSFVVAVDASPWTEDIATGVSTAPGSLEDDRIFSNAVISAADYWEWNSKLESRSSLAHGLFMSGKYRGNLGVLWTEPHVVSPIELEILQTASAMIELTAAGTAQI